jgi:magnesium chelatase family protein
VEVPALAPQELLQASPGESSAAIRSRCIAAHARATPRQGKPNQALAGHEIDTFGHLEATDSKFLQAAATQLAWSARATHRTLKIARTIADLAGSDSTQIGHVAEAMQYRRALKTA